MAWAVDLLARCNGTNPIVTIGIMVDGTTMLIVVVISKYMQLESLQGVVIITSREAAKMSP